MEIGQGRGMAEGRIGGQIGHQIVPPGAGIAVRAALRQDQQQIAQPAAPRPRLAKYHTRRWRPSRCAKQSAKQ